MPIVWGVGLGLGGVLTVAYVVGLFNGLIQVKQNIDKAWANIDVLLKQRHDELPKLIAVCEAYKKFERSTLEAVLSARSHSVSAQSEKDKVRAAGQLSGAVQGLLAVAENYPDLKSAQNFLQIQQRISLLENQIADRREFYNESVNIFNIRIQEIPDRVIAGFMNLEPRTMYRVSENDKRDVPLTFK